EDAANPRQFVLGWENREKRRALADEVLNLRQRWDELDGRIKNLQQEVSDLRARQASVRRAQEVVDFAAIDHATPQREVVALRMEKRKIEENDDTVRVLKGRLATAESRQRALQASRDEAVRTEAELLLQLGQGERLIANAESVLKRREAD